MRDDGLYVTLLPDGKIKRYLRTEGQKIPLEDATIVEELIYLSEQDHIQLYQMIKDLRAYADRIEEIEGMDWAIAIELVLRHMRENHILRYTLFYTQIGERRAQDPLADYRSSRMDRKQRALEAVSYFTDTMAADITIDRALTALSSGTPLDLEEEHRLIRHSSAKVTFTLGDTLTPEYYFISEEQYYIFLLQHFIVSKSRVCICGYCGRYFAPQTRRKTAYCDRVVRNGKTCKQIGPYLKHKERAAANQVIREFMRVKDMLLHRLDRTGEDKKASPADMTQEEYYQWLDDATAACDRYLAEELTAEEAFDIIHVPTIHELREQDLAELTVETSAVAS